MLNEFPPTALARSWIGAVAIVTACALAAGITVEPSMTALLLALSLLPPAIILLFARRAPALAPQIVRARPAAEL
jgi:hypothetical protein